jgi:hypothetical protein
LFVVGFKAFGHTGKICSLLRVTQFGDITEARRSSVVRPRWTMQIVRVYVWDVFRNLAESISALIRKVSYFFPII